MGVAYLIGVALAVPIGMISPRWYSLFDYCRDHSRSSDSRCRRSSPILLIIVFSINLRWFPFIYDSNLGSMTSRRSSTR